MSEKLQEATMRALQGKLTESKKISIYDDDGTPYSLSNEIKNVPMFRDDIEDSGRDGYLDIIKNYLRTKNVDVFEETQSSIRYKFETVFGGTLYLRIVDNMGSDSLGKVKKISCTNKSGVNLSVSYAGIKDIQAYKKDINSASKDQYVAITEKYTPYEIKQIRQNDEKTVLEITDSLDNIFYLYIKE